MASFFELFLFILRSKEHAAWNEKLTGKYMIL